jgi:hypothetical protein
MKIPILTRLAVIAIFSATTAVQALDVNFYGCEKVQNFSQTGTGAPVATSEFRFGSTVQLTGAGSVTSSTINVTTILK